MVSHLILAIPALKHQVNLIISISICTHKSNGTKRDLTKRDIIENKLPSNTLGNSSEYFTILISLQQSN